MADEDTQPLNVPPKKSLKYYLRLLSNGNFFYEPLQSPYQRKTKDKCIRMDGEPDYIVRYMYDQKNDKRIYDNGIPDEVLDRYNPSYFTFLIDDQGIRFGHVRDALELGVPHMMLIRNEEDRVYISGEVGIIRYNNGNFKLYYNFNSGTFSLRYNLVNHPNAEENYKNIVYQILKLTFPQMEIIYTDYPLFRTGRPSVAELDDFCERHPERIFTDPLVPNCHEAKPDFERAFRPENDICKRRAKYLDTIRQKANQLANEEKQQGLLSSIYENIRCVWCKSKPKRKDDDDEDTTERIFTDADFQKSGVMSYRRPIYPSRLLSYRPSYRYRRYPVDDEDIYDERYITDLYEEEDMW